MIVKNESRCLEKCLKALEPLRNAIPCELVIADTGSTDNTKEIASKYADTLFDFTWVNDFSKALFSEITFPEEFYNTPTEKQQELLENVGKSKYFSANLIAKYFEDSFINNFNKLSFSYNLITSVWASIEEADNESSATLKGNFYDISRLFLTNLYNPEILENDIVFSTLSPIHRFSIYL